MNKFTKSLVVALWCFSLCWASNTNGQTIDINTYAGNGVAGYSGNGGPAIAAEILLPAGVAIDGSGNVYITDQYNNLVRKVNTSGVISTFAGSGTPPNNSGYSGDGGAATAAELNGPTGVAIDSSGNIYISDSYNNVIRKVNTSGIISTFAGNGFDAGSGFGNYSGDGGPATAAELNLPAGLVFGPAGHIYIADQYNNVIRMVNTSGIISTIAGNGIFGYSGDDGAATAAELNLPVGVAYDNVNNIYVADQYNNVIRKINTGGVISTIAGNGYGAGLGLGEYTGDGEPATSAELYSPSGITVDSDYNIYISDGYNNVIRMVNTSGIISTIAGNGFDAGNGFGIYSGDGGPATAAGLYYPAGIALNSSGSLYIADQNNNRIRYLCTSPPTPGSITGDTLICLFSSQTYSIRAVAGATSYTWILPFGWTGSSSDTTITISSITFNGTISVTANNDCGGSTARTLTVNLASAPPEPDNIIGDTTFCPSSILHYSINKVAGATSYTWTLPFGWTGSSTDTSITTTSSSYSGSIEVFANDCEWESPIRSLSVNLVSPPAEPDTIIGDTSFCLGADLTYYTHKVTGATSYTWILPYGWTGSSTDTSITAATDSNAGGIIEVSADDCGGGGIGKLLSVNLVSPPSEPDTIYGDTTICAGTYIYRTPSVSGATSYTWVLPYGWTGSSTSDTIAVVIDSTAGVIEVAANGCGGSGSFKSLNVKLPSPPSQPDTIYGDTTVCAGTYIYRTPSISGATSYTWILPYGWTGSSTSDTIAVVVDSTAGVIGVAGNNCGGSGSFKSLFVNLPSPPAQPDTIYGDTIFCSGTAQKYYVHSVYGATDYTWYLPYGWTGSSTDTSITVTPDSNSGFIEVSANNCGGNSWAPWKEVTNLITLFSPSICYVSVDTILNRNDIFWDKSGWDTLAIDSVRIYKEITTSFVKIGEVSIHDTGSFIDTGSRPKSVSNFYGIAVVDTCLQESYSSSYNETILLQANEGVRNVVNLSWNAYVGESVNYYRIMREANGTSPWIELDSVPNSIFAFTDTNPPASSDCRYLINTIWDLDCTPSIHHGPTKRIAIASEIASESNIQDIAVTGINELNTSSLEIYPNPVTDVLNVVLNQPIIDGVLTIVNVLGQDVYSEKITENTMFHINMSGLQQGVYILKIETNGQTLLKKIVKI